MFDIIVLTLFAGPKIIIIGKKEGLKKAGGNGQELVHM